MYSNSRRSVGLKHPLGRVALSSEVAAVVVFLFSEGAGFVTGSVYQVDGGYCAQ